MRHVGKLSEGFCKKELERSNLQELAVMAAKFRSDGNYCGTATSAIRRWVHRHKTQEQLREYDAYYRVAWAMEKDARSRGAHRPDKKDRPCVGTRPLPRRHEAQFVRIWDEPLAAVPQPKSSAYA